MSFGRELNNITGASDLSKQSYKYNLRLQKQNQQWQTEMANTAHQREVQDLQSAGLNPVLSAGGGGAATGSPGGGGVGMNSGMNPLDLIQSLTNSLSTIKQTENNTARTNTENKNETEMTRANVAKALAEAGVKQNEIDYYVKHGVFPGATVKGSFNVGASAFGTGINGGAATEIPVGLKNPFGEPKPQKPTSARKKKELKGLEGLY